MKHLLKKLNMLKNEIFKVYKLLVLVTVTLTYQFVGCTLQDKLNLLLLYTIATVAYNELCYYTECLLYKKESLVRLMKARPAAFFKLLIFFSINNSPTKCFFLLPICFHVITNRISMMMSSSSCKTF